jgi:hypothetical protein
MMRSRAIRKSKEENECFRARNAYSRKFRQSSATSNHISFRRGDPLTLLAPASRTRAAGAPVHAARELRLREFAAVCVHRARAAHAREEALHVLLACALMVEREGATRCGGSGAFKDRVACVRRGVSMGRARKQSQ